MTLRTSGAPLAGVRLHAGVMEMLRRGVEGVNQVQKSCAIFVPKTLILTFDVFNSQNNEPAGRRGDAAARRSSPSSFHPSESQAVTC